MPNFLYKIETAMINSKNTLPLAIAQIEKAHDTIRPMVHRTPILTSNSLDQISGARLFFKCENFQKIGAFKIRGAVNALSNLSEEEKQRGVATHSSGNHAQAIASTAQSLGMQAWIVMPDTSPKIKKIAVEGYGAEIIESKANIESRETKLNEVVQKTGATFIHPFDNYDVIAGQATCAKELIEDTDDLDIIMAPVGGGGLLSGTALSTYYFSPNTRVIGAEPKEVDDAFRSMQLGVIQKNSSLNTIADGLKTNLGEKTFPIIKSLVEEIITVSEEEIINAMRLIWERMKIIIEPSCAVLFAAVLQQPEKFKDKKVGIILTGGNVDVEKLPF